MKRSAPVKMRVPQAVLAAEETAGTDLRILIPALILVAFGMATVFSASIPIAAIQGSKDVFFYLKRELAFVAVGLVVLTLTRAPSLKKLEACALPLYGLTLLLLVGVHFFGKEVNGAKSWYQIPVLGVSFQPSEMAKLVLVIALARYFTKFPKGLREWRELAPPVVMMLLFCGSIAMESDMGTTVVIGLTLLVFFHLAGARFRHVAALAGGALLVGGMKIYHEPYQWQRIVDFFIARPGAELEGNYQITRSLIALGSGGLTGSGYSWGIEKYFYLPEPTTDSILAVIGEELGLFATWLIVGLFAYLTWQGLRVAAQAEDRFSGLVAAGVTCFFTVQGLLNIAVITGAVPTTGVTLPLVSYGGSSLLFSLAGIGLLLNVSRRTQEAAATR